MNLITKIKIIRDTYKATTKEKFTFVEGEDKWDYETRVRDAEKEKPFVLPNNVLPKTHILRCDAKNIIIMGDMGSGKTTFLLNIAESLSDFQYYQKTGNSAHVEGSKDLPLFTDWQKINDAELFSQFKDDQFINLVYDSILKRIPLTEVREKNLLDRINRNSKSYKGSKITMTKTLQNSAKKEGMQYNEYLEKFTLFVETGIYFTRHPSAQAMFGNYELIFNTEINPMQIKAEYVNFYNLPGKGLSQGQKTFKTLEQLTEKSNDLSLLLLDEPTNSIPTKSVTDAAELIRKMKGQKFIATHSENLLEQLTLHEEKTAHISFYTRPATVIYL
jgi:ABC-type cobalamin/Fe3+-siderophores transport system ATPase subunit